MKIRNGFVSNSSSSSFVIFGQIINLKNAEKYIREGKTIIVTVEGWEGPIIIEVDNLEMLSYVMAHEELGNEDYSIYHVYLAFSWCFDGSADEIDLSTLPKEGTAIIDGGTCDQFSVHDINGMREYVDATDGNWEEYKNKASSILTKRMRKEKLIEIDENS